MSGPPHNVISLHLPWQAHGEAEYWVNSFDDYFSKAAGVSVGITGHGFQILKAV